VSGLKYCAGALPLHRPCVIDLEIVQTPGDFLSCRVFAMDTMEATAILLVHRYARLHMEQS
jgi:hypothetical protein